jgi:hypothetical protein
VIRTVASLLLLLAGTLSGTAQNVFGFWYGTGVVRTNQSTDNYLMELVLQPQGNQVKGILNYYFRDAFRSVAVKGDYSASTRQLNLYDIPVTYFGSRKGFEMDCKMDLTGSLRVAQAGSRLFGSLRPQADHKYMCPEVRFNFQLNSEASQGDSVLMAISQFKETYQIWTPALSDTIYGKVARPKKVVDPEIEQQFSERKTEVIQEIEVSADTILVSIYDNGEVDGDRISLFYNQELILQSQKLTHKSIRFRLPVQPGGDGNELSMFAENLGLIPPNTALMVIQDGSTRHELSVSSNLEKNASIRIRKRPSP